MGTPPLSSTKEEIAVVVLTYVLPGLLGVLFPHHFNFFEILALACISLPLPLAVSCQQLPAFPSGFLALPSTPPPLVCFMLFGSFFGRIVTVLVKFFKSIKSVAFVTGLHALKSRWAGTSSGTDQVCGTPYQCRSKLAASFPLWRAATLAMWASGRCLGVSLSNLAESVG